MLKRCSLYVLLYEIEEPNDLAHPYSLTLLSWCGLNKLINKCKVQNEYALSINLATQFNML